MSDDNTTDLTVADKLDMILARLSALEAIAEDRSRDTRPLLDSLHAHVDRLGADIGDIKAIVKRLDSGFTQLSRELIDLKARQHDIESRV